MMTSGLSRGSWWRATTAVVVTVVVVGIALVANPQQAHATTTFTSSGATDSSRPWTGYGFNEYPVDRNNSGADIAWTPSDLALTESRIAYMHPSLIRLNWYTDWFNPSGTAGTYDWTTLEAKDAFQIMDFLNTQHIPVQIGLWHAENAFVDNATYFTSQAFADKQADFINEMVNVRGYTNIKFYGSVNEPNGVGYSYANWNTMVDLLKTTLTSRGLPTSLIVGPDTTGNNWPVQVAADHGTDLGAYESHHYTPTETVPTIQADAEQNINSYPNNNVPAYYGEMGIGGPDHNRDITSFGYGLDMIDYGIQAGRAGVGALAWCFDGFDGGKNCGMYDISGQNQTAGQLRPWFYSWSLLNKYFPGGWIPAQMPETSNLRILAAHSPGATADWSFALVNRDTQDSQVTLQVPGWGSGTFEEFVYSPSSATTDSNGFPIPVGTVSTSAGGLSTGVTVTVPAGSAVVLTTVGQSQLNSTSSSSVGTIVDHLTDWSHTSAHSSGLAIDSSNPQYFAGDTARAKRVANTTEHIDYNVTSGVTGYRARVYFYGSDFADATLQTSVDGTTWLNNSTSAGAETVTGSNWGYQDISNAAALPTGTKYVRVVLSADAHGWAPQLAEMVVLGPPTFSTGFETGQPPLAYVDTVDGSTSNVSNPKAHVSSTLVHSGSNSVYVAGTVTASASSDYAYMKAFDFSGTPTTIAPTTVLTYWVYPQSQSQVPTVGGNNSACVSVDISYTDGSALRSFAPRDENGQRITVPCQAVTLDRWNEMIVPLGYLVAGKQISGVDFVFDRPESPAGGYSAYIDDFSLSN